MKNDLRSVIEAARDEARGSLADFTVLSAQIDPYRLDTPANHEVGKWFADQINRLNLLHRRLHLRGIHYALLGSTQLLSGKPLLSSAWSWSDQTIALKARKSYSDGAGS
jgi:hypothetical protein